MKRQFSQAHIVRYDECDCDGCLTPSAFLRYMQDIAALDSEDAQLEGQGYWVVRRTVIAFAAPVPIHTRLQLRTYGIGFTRITAQRGYEAHLAEDISGDPIITARTIWVYLDPRGRPIRLPERTGEIWLPDGPLPLQAEEPFPALPESPPESTRAVVRFSDIDLMRHLNNASAVEMLDNAAWEVYARVGVTPDTARFRLLGYDIDYLDSPRFGEELTIQTWLEPSQTAGQEGTRLQLITRAGTVMVRARSRWLREKD
jgi:acyl-CoA thioesterase FadM